MLTCFFLFFFSFCLIEVLGLNMCAGGYVWKISKISFESCIYLKGFQLKKVHKKEVDYYGRNFIFLGKSKAIVH